MADEGGFEELRRLGARSVPVVSRGDRFVFAQVIRDVVEFLGLDEKTSPVLSPAELHARYDHVLETAIRLVRQMPVDKLEIQLPNRPRSWRMVMHHIFQIPTAYLDMEEEGGTLSRERLGVLPPAEMRTSAAIADFGWIKVRGALAWWIWGIVHIYFLIGVRNRLGVALSWLWIYLLGQRSARLITQGEQWAGEDKT